MKITGTAHIKTDKTEVRIEVWDADYWGDGSGLSASLCRELEGRGYIDTGDNITGMRLIIPANQGKVEMDWLTTQGIPLSAGHFYD
uniref:Uncharacterized protein n=1 Tax=viral metagenome TaxID=1070528 RepID=A0A6M3KLG1_9ZZZZ